MLKSKPVDQHPTLVGIWKRLYLIEMPEMYMRDEEDIRARGTFTLGSPDKDMKHQNSYGRAYRTINQIFELWKQGVEIYIVKYEDTENIYNAIEKHLSTWHRYLSQGIGISACPFDELLELDKFANTVYDKAKYVFTAESLKPIATTVSKLGFSMNPMDFRFKKTGGNVRYNHSFKSESEVLMEQGLFKPQYHDRKGYESELLEVASRYDVRLTEKEREGVRPLSLDLKFGNS